MPSDPRSRAWIELSGPALLRNLERVRSRAGTPVIPMVKADAYGLGVEEVVRRFEGTDPWAFGVAAVSEGRRLRDLGVRRRIVVFSPTPPGEVREAVDLDLAIAVSDGDALARLEAAARAAGRPAAFHVEIDSGMGRAGVPWREAGRLRPALDAVDPDQVRWEGCFTHFHSADDDVEGASVRVQWDRFQEALRTLAPLPDAVLVHAGNSAGGLRFPEWTAGAVRPGIFLYGGTAGPVAPAPDPVAAVRARVALVRAAEPGATVGYGATHAAALPETWATVAIGYGDGLPRALGNRGRGIVRGTSVPIVGRISMDVTVVDITRVPGVVPGDVVTFVGSDGAESIPLEEVAGLAGTINYEILTGLTARLPRVWVEE